MTITVGSLTSSDPELAAIAAKDAIVNTFPVYTGVNPTVVTNKTITSTGEALLSQTSPGNALFYLGGAPITSPNFAGVPTCTTPVDGSPENKIATVGYVTNATSGLYLPLAGGIVAGDLTVTGPNVDLTLVTSTDPAQMYISAPLNKQSYIYFLTSGVNPSAFRWVIGKESTAEAGGTTGTDGARFQIYAYKNDGSPSGYALIIDRNRHAQFYYSPTIAGEVVDSTFPTGTLATVGMVNQVTSNLVPKSSPTINGTATFTGSVLLDDGSNLYIRHDTASSYLFIDSPISTSTNGYASIIVFQANSLNRWIIGKDTADEAGTRQGANFYIYGYDNTGAPIGPAVTITRNNFVAAFTATPTAPTQGMGTNSTELATTEFVNRRVDQLGITAETVDVSGGIGSVTNNPIYPPNFLYVRGGFADGFWDYKSTAPTTNQPYIHDASGNSYIRPEVEFPRGPKVWEFDWWFPGNSSTTNQAPLLQKAVDAYIASLVSADNTEVVLRLPAGKTIGIGSRVTLTDAHRLTIEGPATAILRKTVGGIYPFFADLGVGGIGGPGLINFTLRGFTIDGGNIAEADNNWPFVYFFKGRDIEFCNLTVQNACTGLRVGTNTPETGYDSYRVNIHDNYIYNMSCHGVEIRGASDSHIANNTCIAGPMSGTSGDGIGSSRAIRVLRSNGVSISGNNIRRLGSYMWGSGITLNSSNYNIRITDNLIHDCHYNDGGSIWSYGILDHCVISNNVLFNSSSGASRQMIWIGEDTTDATDPGSDYKAEDIQIYGNILEAGPNVIYLIQVQYWLSVDIHNNLLKHLNNQGSNIYGVYVGLSSTVAPQIVIHDNHFHMNGTFNFPIYFRSTNNSTMRACAVNNYYNANCTVADFVQNTSSGGLVEAPNYPYA